MNRKGEGRKQVGGSRQRRKEKRGRERSLILIPSHISSEVSLYLTSSSSGGRKRNGIIDPSFSCLIQSSFSSSFFKKNHEKIPLKDTNGGAQQVMNDGLDTNGVVMFLFSPFFSLSFFDGTN